jgi:hypothetical protein
VAIVGCRRVARSLLLVACVIVAAACSHGAHRAQVTTPPRTPQGRAVAACRAASPAPATFFNAQAATVGELRSYRFGPNARPLVKAFPKAKTTAFAAWCWGRKANGYYVAYVVGPDGSKVVYGQADGITPPRPGMPSVFT